MSIIVISNPQTGKTNKIVHDVICHGNNSKPPAGCAAETRKLIEFDMRLCCISEKWVEKSKRIPCGPKRLPLVYAVVQVSQIQELADTATKDFEILMLQVSQSREN
jgi:hypothetical protein